MPFTSQSFGVDCHDADIRTFMAVLKSRVHEMTATVSEAHWLVTLGWNIGRGVHEIPAMRIACSCRQPRCPKTVVYMREPIEIASLRCETGPKGLFFILLGRIECIGSYPWI